jgi:hypothetical protein
LPPEQSQPERSACLFSGLYVANIVAAIFDVVKAKYYDYLLQRFLECNQEPVEKTGPNRLPFPILVDYILGIHRRGHWDEADRCVG